MDKLEHIFALQKAFDDDVIENRHLQNISKEEWIQRITLAMMSELSELCDAVNFKWWKNPKAIDEDAVREEMVDILHFFISMCLKTGMDAEDLHNRYMAKNAENFARQQGRSEKKGYELDQQYGR